MRTWRLPKGEHIAPLARKTYANAQDAKAVQAANIPAIGERKVTSDRGGDKPGMRSSGKAFRVAEVWGCRQNPVPIGGTSVAHCVTVKRRNTTRL